jgi:hypothetical protein
LAKVDFEDLMRLQREAFVAKFGREPGPDDPILFDPDADNPQVWNESETRKQMVQGMREVGIPPQLIFIYERTGLIVTPSTKLTPAQRHAFEAAVEEWVRLEAEGKAPTE